MHRAVRAFNDFPADAQPPHVERMRLILHTPALQSHSVAAVRRLARVIAEYVAERLGLAPDDPLPVLVGHVSLALAHSAYDAWLADPTQPLPGLVTEQMALLQQYLVTEQRR